MNRVKPDTQHVANMADVLAQIQRSGGIHFVKSLPKTAFHIPKVRQTAKLSLPAQFVQENGHKIEEWVTLRPQSSSSGRRSSSSWPVHLCVAAIVKVQMVGGWPAFVTGNRLMKGDYLIFLLREDAKSEFDVFMFRGPRGSPYFPNEGEEEEEEENDSDSEKEEKTNNQSRRLPSPAHQQDERNQAFARDIREGNPAPLQHPGNYPGVLARFSKRLMASNIGRSNGEIKSGQFEFPRGFIRTHGDQVHSSVKLQGIHENSTNYAITCRRRPGDFLKVYFNPTEWSRFVEDNGLKEGHEIQFSLMAESYFLVRKIS